MSGTIQSLSLGIEATKAVGAYEKKFSFIREFFRNDRPLDLNAFSDHFGVGFYRFTPGNVYYLDNSVDFSFRAKVPI